MFKGGINVLIKNENLNIYLGSVVKPLKLIKGGINVLITKMKT